MAYAIIVVTPLWPCLVYLPCPVCGVVGWHVHE